MSKPDAVKVDDYIIDIYISQTPDLLKFGDLPKEVLRRLAYQQLLLQVVYDDSQENEEGIPYTEWIRHNMCRVFHLAGIAYMRKSLGKDKDSVFHEEALNNMEDGIVN